MFGRIPLIFAATFLLVVQTRANIADDFKELTELFPGFYDNVDQYNSDISKGLPPKQRHQRLQTSLAEEDVSFLQNTVNYYIEQYTNNDKNDVIRQRLYTIGIDPDSGRGLVLKIYAFKNPSRFLHAKPFDPIFYGLLEEDIIYAEGCDVFWYKADASPLRFESWNEKTCVVTINGQKVLVDTTNNITKSYLTSSERWLLPNGTDILGEPSAYNMTRMTTATVAAGERAPVAAMETKRAADNESLKPVNLFTYVVESLFGGRPVRFYAILSLCNRRTLYSPGAQPFPVESVGGPVDVFEYFNDTVFGPDEYFGFSFSERTFREEGFVMELTEVLAFGNNGQVFVNITVLSDDLKTAISKTSYSCSMTPLNGIPASARFFVDGRATLTPLTDYDSLHQALMEGYQVRTTCKYINCQGVGYNAVGGTVIEDFEVYHDRIQNAQAKVITNYQGAGYVYDVVSAVYWPNGSVIYTASDVDVVTYEVFYKETIACHFGGDSTSFYKLL